MHASSTVGMQECKFLGSYQGWKSFKELESDGGLINIPDCSDTD